jgi:II/X family phage/plasmid replication protein
VIDWLTAVIPYAHETPIFGGAVLAYDQDGALRWKRESFRELEGSFESTTVCRTYWDTDAAARAGQTSQLWISGNPAKFHQGHNCFGSDDLRVIAPLYFRRVVESLGLSVDRFTCKRWEEGDWRLARVDVAKMIDVGGRPEVHDFLAAMAHQASVAHRGRGHMNHGTVSWGKRSSKNHVLKCYDKFAELTNGSAKHGLPPGISFRSELLAYVAGKVRIESEFHARFLDKRGLRSGSAWTRETATRLWEEAMTKMNLSGQMPLTPQLLKQLPPRLQRTYMAWESGRDLRAWMSYATFKRHRKDLLPCGVDISQPYNAGHQPRVISISKVISAVPSPIPAWAFGTPLLLAA